MMLPLSSHSARFLVVDDHALLRQGISSVLSHIDKQVRVTEADNLAQALHTLQMDALQPGAPAREPIDTVLLDLELPDSTGLDTLIAVRAANPQPRIVVVSAHNDEQLAKECIREGACGFIPKQGNLVEFQHALSVIAAGRLYFPQHVLINTQCVRPRASAAVPHKPLTPRQQEVLEWLLKGLTNAKIAQKLGISAETVKLHVSAILQAFNVTTRIDLVLAYANDPARRESA